MRRNVKPYAPDVAGSQLFYPNPAANWLEALPLGNGHLGVMYFADPIHDRLALNHDTLWSGYPECWRDNPHMDGYNDDRDRSASWTTVKQLTAEGRYEEAEAIIQRDLVGPFSQSYLPLGDIRLDFEGIDATDISHFKRCLDLETAISMMSFRAKSASFHRSLFCSFPDQVAVMELVTDAAEGMTVRLSHHSPWLLDSRTEILSSTRASQTVRGRAPSEGEPGYHNSSPDAVFFRAKPEQQGMRLVSGFEIETDGVISLHSYEAETRVPASGEGAAVPRELAVQGLKVSNASYIRLYWSSATSFNGFDKQPEVEGNDENKQLEQIFSEMKRGDLLERHLQDYRALYGRTHFNLETAEGGIPKDLPARLMAHAQGEGDHKLYELLFNYSRYLMIAGSRPGTQALNLQGIWNEEIQAPWSSNYTININTEMNYWPAEVLGLGDCAEPLLSMVRDMAVTGQSTARSYYGAPGFVAHHNTDIWRHSRPVGAAAQGSIVWAFWPLGSAWLAAHLRRSSVYSGADSLELDYPVLRAASEFYLSQLMENADGSLVFGPSTSPEHWYMRDGVHTVIAKHTAMSQALIYDLFVDTIEAGRATGGDEAFVAELEVALDRLEMYQISAAVPGMEGTLQEWGDDCPEGDIGHRHVSHLYGLFPGRSITRATPVWREAVRKSMERRGDEGTGWSLGWKTALWARLGDGDRAFEFIKRQLRPVGTGFVNYGGGGGSYANLLGAHPPFQIDGNFAAGAAVAELFLQVEHDTDLYLLPALPSSWRQGEMLGLRAPYQLEVSLRFADGRLTEARFLNHGAIGRSWAVHYDGATMDLFVGAGMEEVLSF